MERVPIGEFFVCHKYVFLNINLTKYWLQPNGKKGNFMTDWTKYFRLLVKNIRIVLVIMVVFVSLATYVSLYGIEPQYQASTRLIVLIDSQVNTNGSVYEDLLASQLLVKNYEELIKSRAVSSEVIKKVKLSGMTDDDFAAIINVELVPESSMIRILAKNASKEVAVNIANEASTVFIQKAGQFLKTGNISLIDTAIASEIPVYPRPLLTIGFSFLAGILLSLSLILVLLFFDDTLGDSEEIEKKTGLAVVGIIPDMKIR